MRILITGGFGFIGGRLAQHLFKAGHHVVLGSRTYTSSPDWLPEVDVVQANWNDCSSLKQICRGIDVVIHAAGMNARECAQNPVVALEFNGLATARLVEAAILAKVKRFLYLSTAHVYANPLSGIITEESCPRNLHPYATSHLAGEHALLGANQLGEIEGFVLRLSNAFGVPVQKEVNCWMLLVNDLCRQAVEACQLVLHSSGIQERDFISMGEVCRVLAFLIVCPVDLVSSPVINVGSGISHSVLEMACMVQQRCLCVLGHEPTISRPKKTSDEGCDVMLEYRTNRLSETGVKVVVDHQQEIDLLLRFCNSAFNTSK